MDFEKASMGDTNQSRNLTDKVGSVSSEACEFAQLQAVQNEHLVLVAGWNSFVADFTNKAENVVGQNLLAEKTINDRYAETMSAIGREHDRAPPPNALSERPMDFMDAFSAPAFRDNWGKSLLGGFVLGWIFVSFGFAFFAAMAMMGLLLFVIQVKQHQKIGREQSALDLRHDEYEADQQVANGKREKQEDKRKLQLDEQKAFFENEKAPLLAEWAARCTAFNSNIADLQARIETFLAATSHRFFPFSTDSLERSDDAAPIQQLSYRIGETKPIVQDRIDKDLALDLELKGRSVALETAFPVFYQAASRKALFIKGGSKPSSAAKPNVFENIITRILLQIPPGKASFTLIDPLGLGANFAPFLKLQDYSDELISGAVKTSRTEIKRRLADIIEHIETVTQKYLRADYADIESYNQEAGEIAEAYRFICVSDFPENFDEESVRDLVKIIQNGPRCGVHTLLYHNENVKPAYGISLDELLQSSQILAQSSGGVSQLQPNGSSSVDVTLDANPTAGQLKALVESFGEDSIEAMKVEVELHELTSMVGLGSEMWGKRSADEISVPVGPSGAKKALNFTLDSTSRSHNALMVGRPGSGKSNLMHVFIAMVCDQYSPDEVELYLIDFKKGVEFKDYANAKLPHARVIAVESEREFGLSVLKALDAEMTRRSEIFKAANAAESIGEYRKQYPDERMPRAILIVDEFQEFFSQDDTIKVEAGRLMDRIVRQGRSFGVHLVLGTQSLANSGLAASTIGQIPIRIAMNCSDADAQIILSSDNIAARGLSRPGEAIYNDGAGEAERNNSFQVALFKSSKRKEWLAKLAEKTEEHGWTGDPPRIFEGHMSAPLLECKHLTRPAQSNAKPSGTLKSWIGEPISLEEPVYAEFSPQAGRNMLVISREEIHGTNVILAALTSMVSQLPPNDLNIHIVDLTKADADWADFPESLRDEMPHTIEVCGRNRVRNLLPELRKIVTDRHSEADESSEFASNSGPRVVLAIIGAHRARELRKSEGYSAFSAIGDESDSATTDMAECLKEIVTDGPDMGVHTMLWLDSYTGFERIFDRRVMDEFAIRVSGPLPEKDSQTLFDNRVASLITHPNRMVKYDEDIVGVYPLFRPYAVTADSDFENLRKQLFPAAEGGVHDVQ